ncbi:centrosomal protein of 41 kDa [Salarias fasciatus]|uniref:Rhodanese domain-containing protein n=1 Tax=Salarias fasciatus TaxID=181472 RepID=A0A672JBE6_SALFA|nr:centrosomal protein of 41 kDa [Salarias fasciatus]
MSVSRGIGSSEFLNKRLKKNARYEHVKSKLDTGCSLSKYNERLEELRKNYRYRKDEIFKRLDVTTFAQLILQVASVSGLSEGEGEGDSGSHGGEDGVSLGSSAELECVSEVANGSTHTSPSSDREDGGTARSSSTARSTLLSVITGVSELSLNAAPRRLEEPGPAERPYPDCPYLLLDVRDREQYDCCHVIGAHSFPIAMLSRTVNPYSKEVLEYKNASGKIIILYDEDERIASQAATAMCERGFENLFMLCGGLKVIAQKFPGGMTTGSIPASCRSSSTRTKRRPAPQQQPPPPPQAADQRWRFTVDELSRIQEQLEEILLPRGSSKMSCRSAGSSLRSSRSSVSEGSQSRRPWK